MDQLFSNMEAAYVCLKSWHLLKARIFEYYHYLNIKWREHLPLTDLELSQLGLRTTSFKDGMDYLSSFIAGSDPRAGPSATPVHWNAWLQAYVIDYF